MNSRPVERLCKMRARLAGAGSGVRKEEGAEERPAAVPGGTADPSCRLGVGLAVAGGSRRDGLVQVAHQLVEAVEHLAQRLLLLRRELPVQAQDAIDAEASRPAALVGLFRG